MKVLPSSVKHVKLLRDNDNIPPNNICFSSDRRKMPAVTVKNIS